MSAVVPLPPPALESLIVREYPPLFEEFRAKRFNLLWRGSRDGFSAAKFQRRRDDCANTLTLIRDIDGNVFGGFTPVEWENNCWWKGDDSLLSFLFTLRNPRSVPPGKFALRAEKKQDAIYCNSGRGPAFDDSGRYCDIRISDQCNATNYSDIRLGTRWSDRTYANDTAAADFFTDAENFTVKEIEVFKIAD
jgi:hypothetical protein